MMKNPGVKSFARGLVPRRFRTRVRSFVTKRNLKRAERPDDVLDELRAFCRPEVEDLETLLGCDLSAWKGGGRQSRGQTGMDRLPA